MSFYLTFAKQSDFSLKIKTLFIRTANCIHIESE